MNESQVEQALQHLSSRSYDVPIDFQKGIDEVLANLPQSANHPRPAYRKKWIVSTAGFIAGIMLLVSACFVSPTLAQVIKKIPYIGTIISFVGDSGVQVANQSGFVQQVNQTAVDHGIQVTVTEAYYDQLKLSVGIQVTFPKSSNQFQYIKKLRYELAGKSYTREYTEDQFKQASSFSWRYIGNNTYYGTFEPFFLEDLPQQDRMKLDFQNIGGVDGDWRFDIPISRMETDQATKIDEPLVTQSTNEYSVTVKKIIRTPSTTRVILSLGLGERYQSMTEDELGYAIHLLSTKVKVFDQNGKPLPSITRDRGSTFGGITSDTMIGLDYQPISLEPTSLTIKIGKEVELPVKLE